MAAQPAAPAWDAPLQQLLARRVLDGYGLLDCTGKCIASFGSLTAELWDSSSSGDVRQQQQAPPPAAARGEEPTPAARQIHALFSSGEPLPIQPALQGLQRAAWGGEGLLL